MKKNDISDYNVEGSLCLESTRFDIEVSPRSSSILRLVSAYLGVTPKSYLERIIDDHLSRVNVKNILTNYAKEFLTK